MEKIFDTPDDIVSFFLNSIEENGKYKIVYNNEEILIIPKEGDEYYKPVIHIKDRKEFEISLINYVNALNKFHGEYNNLEHYHSLGYFFNVLLFNMTNTDALDLAKYIDKRTATFDKDIFEKYDVESKITSFSDMDFYARRILESPGLETPFCMIFRMTINGISYELPLVRYTVSGDTCHIFAVQMGRDRNFNYQESEYKNSINKLNSGLKQYRNVPPNFVLSLALFIKMLDDKNIHNIVVPDYLFGRYRKYYKGTTEKKSNEILNRILNGFMTLLNRMELQVDGYDIITYPNDVDSFMRIKTGKLSSKNEMLNEIFNGGKTL